jgi:competence protein ComEA
MSSLAPIPSTSPDPPAAAPAAPVSVPSSDASEPEVISIPLPALAEERAATPAVENEDAVRPSASPAYFWLREHDQLVLGVVVLVVFVLMVCHWVRLTRWGLEPVEIERMDGRPYDYKLDVNTATWIEWTLLEGIGETLARRIVADREQNGPFQRIDDLRRVKGIGPKTLDRIRPQLQVTPPRDP